jgi:hypothetical protein
MEDHMKRLALLITLVAMAVPVVAQDSKAPEQSVNSYVELLRQDLKTQKVAILTEALIFSDAEAEVFWPIHREYQNELATLGDTELKLLKQYAATYEDMDDETASTLVDAYFALDSDQLKLNKKYYKKFAGAIGPKRAAQWLQVEGYLNRLIDVQIASQVPLIN